jgi:Ca2+-dependent lipid-binding protein
VSDNTIGMVEFSGVVIIHVLGGKHLPAADVNGKSDPYVEITNGFQTVKTHFVEESLNPFWDEELQMNCQSLKTGVLNVRVLDHDVIGKDDILGTTKLPLEELQNHPKESWLDKKLFIDEHKKAYIKLRLKFINLT